MLGEAKPPTTYLLVIKLELVNHTYSNDIIGSNARCFREIALINQVDFVVNKSGHIFVEVIGCTYINIFNRGPDHPKHPSLFPLECR